MNSAPFFVYFANMQFLTQLIDDREDCCRVIRIVSKGDLLKNIRNIEGPIIYAIIQEER
jgi:hypothetical protein